MHVVEPKTAKNRKQRKGEQELHELLALAKEKVPSDLSRNAVKDAFRLSQTLRLRIPLEEKRKLCKHCYTYLKAGVTSQTRVAKGRIIITCLHCKHVKRLQYSKSKK
jgi:ribonuclease P protein subunit RPR2